MARRGAAVRHRAAVQLHQRGNLRRTGCTVPPFTSTAEHRERRIACESIPGLLTHCDLLHRQSPPSLTRGIAEIARPPSIAEGDAHDPKPTALMSFDRAGRGRSQAAAKFSIPIEGRLPDGFECVTTRSTNVKMTSDCAAGADLAQRWRFGFADLHSVGAAWMKGAARRWFKRAGHLAGDDGPRPRRGSTPAVIARVSQP
jgi:hypothetical protein